MCDSYEWDKRLSRETNLRREEAECAWNNEQLGHCVVYVDGGWNVPGMSGRPDGGKSISTSRRKRKSGRSRK